MGFLEMLERFRYTAIQESLDTDAQVRVHIGNLLYDVDYIDTVIDMDTNRPNIVIHVKEN